MNIAMVVYSHYSRDARVRRYAESLSRRGFSIDVICLKDDYQPKERNITLIKYPLPRKRLGRLWYIFEYISFFLYSSIILTSYFLIRKYKIIHVHNIPDCLIFTTIIPRLFSSKIILDVHDPMPELYMSKYHADQNNFVVRLLIFLEKLSFYFANHIITANEEFKKIFLKRHNRILNHKIDVILNCPDTNIFKPKPETRNLKPVFTLLYMGTVEERFGLDIAIDAIPQLLGKIPQIRFIIIPKIDDEGKYFSLLKKKIKSLNLSEHIFILKPQPLEKIAEKISEADIGIVLAQNGIFTENIFPVKLLEFVQMNIPVIASKTKILAKSFDNKAMYFLEKNTPEEFEEAVIILWKSKKLREKIANNAKKYLIKNNWKNEEKKYLKLL